MANDLDLIANLISGNGPNGQPPVGPPNPPTDFESGSNLDQKLPPQIAQAVSQSVPRPDIDPIPDQFELLRAGAKPPSSGQMLPPQVTDLINNAQQSSSQPPMIKGGLPASAANEPPRMQIGGLPGLILDMLHPGRGVPAGQLAPTKMQHFEGFLANFLNSLAQGFSQEGHGPGAAMRGASAAMQAPYNLAQQQFGLRQQAAMQQAQIEHQRAQTQQTEEQTKLMGSSVPITLANGQQVYLPYAIAQKAFPAQLTGQYGVRKEEIKAQNRLDVETMKMKLVSAQATKFIPDVDDNGQRVYHVMNRFGQKLGDVDVNVISQFMSKTQSGFELKQGKNGEYIRIPKMSTTSPMIPVKGKTAIKGESQGVADSSMPTRKSGGKFWYTGGYGMAAVPVLDSAGNPVYGKDPENIRTMSETAKATLPHIDEINQELDEMEKLGVLGEFKGKGTSTLMKYGFAVPGLTAEERRLTAKFVDDVKLMDSAMLRTHFGARGGQQMYEKFAEMLNSGEDPDLIRGSLDSFRGFLEGYKDMPVDPIANPNDKNKKGGGGGGGDNKSGPKKNKDGFVIVGH